VFHKWDNILKKNFARNEFDIFKRTTIGNDVWIGNRVSIKAGVKIADGAVIGMSSVVTKDVGPYEIWAGNPAKLIRKRFDDETVEGLLTSQWWDWEDEKITEVSEKFISPKEFLN
jgi:acetyltransferase-like isoleucine patch superfamily enzyme